MKKLLSVSLCLAAGMMASLTGARAAPSSECDRLGANPDDPSRVSPGVYWSVLDGNAAEAACRRALEQDPTEVRFVYQYGRALARLDRNDEAIAYLSQAAEAGYLIAYTTLGAIFHFVTLDYAEAASWYRQGAELGSPSAQVLLGDLYRRGRGIEKDPKAALAWYRKAADGGYPLAYSKIGELYERGIGLSKDARSAAAWYRRGAEQDLPRAQHALGLLYLAGKGVPKDEEQAADWLQRAADQGFGNAQLALAELLASRAGPGDLKMAYFWYTIASRHRSEKVSAAGQAGRMDLRSGLTSQERKEVRALAAKWRQKLILPPMQ
ncbi:MAG: tetratricopeptide repeat protein [Kiloniellales bacterium]|nr:tetratricopeptide repeat protein [Kiloniellales bacterium]